jgi:hypothetical protein
MSGQLADPKFHGGPMEAMEKIDFRNAELDAIVSTFLHQGSVLLCNFADTAALDAAHGVVLKAYEKTERKHVYPDLLRQFGLPMYSDVLFTQRHHDLLDKVFGGRGYQIDQHTASRRVAMVRKPPHWGMPLTPHLDAFVNALEFTINFWIPFQACGTDAPSLGVILAPFDEIVAYTGWQNGAEVWLDPEPMKYLTLFRPAMKALYCGTDPGVLAEMHDRFGDRIRTPAFEPGDAMMISNWTLHFTHTTPQMTKSRENLELRFSSSASLDDVMREHGVALRAVSIA